ncbi:MAG: gluconate 2-dehydrogenase subunit 3 family protein [Chloroherpetonaceae bacterium]|nr:gluconate 2-dehydrogenase subunit 3 family protein [Chthonomonadaceae bacterium]MDW8206544.1 gluconate 2-dehydrogenase subunit 3 family protein [Chloroherpetonaceae bacterium]
MTEVHWQTLRAVMDRVVPPDDFPGAWDAGVGEYLRRQLARDLKHLALLYDLGLEAIDAEARARHGSAFAALTAAEQDAILRDVESGRVVAFWPVEPGRFFRMLVEHVQEGFYADPGNGGNRDGVAWRMIGYGTGPQDEATHADV